MAFEVRYHHIQFNVLNIYIEDKAKILVLMDFKTSY